MARVRNSALAAKRRRDRPVSDRTIKRRARKATAEQETAMITTPSGRKQRAPETLGQARVWSRKFRRYQLAGLCDICAAAAAWGHAEGFGELERVGRRPCAQCQPLVDKFDTPGPRGSKWRKCLTKLEYMTEAQLGDWIDAHAPEDDDLCQRVPENSHPVTFSFTRSDPERSRTSGPTTLTEFDS